MSDMLTRIEQNDPTITAREIFEHVVVNLLRQEKSSRKDFRHDSHIFDGRTRCAYRGDFGAKCAVGWVIPDSMYQPHWEHLTAREIIPRLPEALHEHTDLLARLQQVHDDAALGFSGAYWRCGPDFCKALVEGLTHHAFQLEPWVPTAGSREAWEGYLRSLYHRAREPVPA